MPTVRRLSWTVRYTGKSRSPSRRERWGTAAAALSARHLTHCGSPRAPGLRCGLQRRLTKTGNRDCPEGLSGPAVASRLVLSVRPVNSHLQRIYAKLGISSRHQVASALEGYRDTALPES
ncbi:DNA-binding response regulator [Streptomyces sp. WAC04770]|nr:DNA-binding response regulator [Streptomyces sp. WAC04770]